MIRRIREDLPRLESLKGQAQGMLQSVRDSKRVFLEWHEVCCMNDAQRRDRLKELAASMLKIINTPMREAPGISVIAPVETPVSEDLVQ